MKKFFKVFMVALIITVIPLLSACSLIYFNKNQSYNLNIEFNSIDEGNFSQLTKVTDENNYYSINFEGDLVLYIDSHDTNLFEKIDKNKEVALSFYLSPLSMDIEFLLNNNAIQYETSEIDSYQCYEITFVMDKTQTLCVNGSFFML